MMNHCVLLLIEYMLHTSAETIADGIAMVNVKPNVGGMVDILLVLDELNRRTCSQGRSKDKQQRCIYIRNQ